MPAKGCKTHEDRASGGGVAGIETLTRSPKPAHGPDYPEIPAMPQAPDGGLKQIAEWIVSHKR